MDRGSHPHSPKEHIMSGKYDSIPATGGAHEKDIPEKHSGMNVRAPKAEDHVDSSTDREETFNVLVHDAKGWYRVTRQQKSVEGYRRAEDIDISAGISPIKDQLGGGPLYVVLENDDTGEVFYEADHNLSDNWSDGGRFDTATIFSSEEEAASYVDERRSKA
jgi:hypothetical protein